MKDLGKKAPIVEAILHAEFNFSDKIAIEKLDALADSFSKDFPFKQPTVVHEAFVSFSDKVTSSQEQHIDGYRIDSEDRKKVLQARRNSLAFSLLKPYSNGDLLIEEYKGLWEKYTQAVSPKGIGKIGLRNINKFYLPADTYNDYLKCAPDIKMHGEAPLFIGKSALNYNVLSPTHEALGNINIMLQAKGDNRIEVIFDIDVIKHLDSVENNFNLIAKHYSSLRDLKNKLFFGNLDTDGVLYE